MCYSGVTSGIAHRVPLSDRILGLARSSRLTTVIALSVLDARGRVVSDVFFLLGRQASQTLSVYGNPTRSRSTSSTMHRQDRFNAQSAISYRFGEELDKYLKGLLGAPTMINPSPAHVVADLLMPLNEMATAEPRLNTWLEARTAQSSRANSRSTRLPPGTPWRTRRSATSGPASRRQKF